MANKGVSTAAARRLAREKGPEMVVRYEAGESYAAIARSFGLSTMAVRNAVKRNGGTPRPRGRYSFPWMMERAKKVRARYEAGESLAVIAADLGVSFTTANQDLVAAGGTSRTKGGFARTPLRGPNNPRWSGGTHIDKTGYRRIWVGDDHQFACMRTSKRSSYVAEHRLVMAEHLGRPLLRTETVHHINGDRLDNRLENLQLRSNQHGPGVRLVCRSCGSNDVEAVAL